MKKLFLILALFVVTLQLEGASTLTVNTNNGVVNPTNQSFIFPQSVTFSNAALTSVATPTSISNYVWTASDTLGHGSWQIGGTATPATVGMGLTVTTVGGTQQMFSVTIVGAVTNGYFQYTGSNMVFNPLPSFGYGNVFTTSNNTYSITSTNIEPGFSVIGTNFVGTGWTSNQTVFQAPKSGIAIAINCDLTQADPIGGIMLGTNLNMDFNNSAQRGAGAIYYRKANNAIYLQAPSVDGQVILTAPIGTILSGSASSVILNNTAGLSVFGSGSGSSYTMNGVAVSTPNGWNFNSGGLIIPASTANSFTNGYKYTASYAGANSPVMGQIVTNNAAHRSYLNISFILNAAAVTDTAKAGIAQIESGVTNIICIESVPPGIAGAYEKSISFMSSPSQIWWGTNLSTGSATAIMDTNAFKRTVQ